MNGQRSALGILLDATELMVARDVSQGRTIEGVQRSLDAAHATLTHIANAVGLKPPTDQEKLKAAVEEIVSERTGWLMSQIMAPESPPKVDLLAIAREWFFEHPYDEDELNDEAISYFTSFQSVAPAAPPSAAERMLADVMRGLLNGQGAESVEDETKVRQVVAKLVNDASSHRAKLGDSMEVATLKRKLAELEAKHGALISEFEKQVSKKGRRR